MLCFPRNPGKLKRSSLTYSDDGHRCYNCGKRIVNYCKDEGIFLKFSGACARPHLPPASCISFGLFLPPYSSCTLLPSSTVPYVVPYACHAAPDPGLCSYLQCPPHLRVSNSYPSFMTQLRHCLPKSFGQGWGEFPLLHLVLIFTTSFPYCSVFSVHSLEPEFLEGRDFILFNSVSQHLSHSLLSMDLLNE